MAHYMDNGNVISQSVADLRQDGMVISHLLDDLERKCVSIAKLPERNPYQQPNRSGPDPVIIKTVCGTVRENKAILKEFSRKLSHPADESNISECIKLKMLILTEIRFLNVVAGSLATASDWQSPSVDASGFHQAGRDAGRIILATNDYKRDQNRDATVFEEKFLSEYVRGPRLLTHVTTASSGMAAFTTILNYLISKPEVRNGTVIVGGDAYWEVREMVQAIFGRKAVTVDEADTEKCRQTIKHIRPAAVFMDTIGNTPKMLVPDLAAIADSMRSLNTVSYLVIDNTCAGPSYQPLNSLYRPLSRVRVIAFESLNKFYQYGMDRVTGGIIYARGGDTGAIFTHRVHSGSCLPDTSASMLPTPDGKILDIRLRRLERNALRIASYLQANLKTGSRKPYITYPGLADHPDYEISRKRGYTGGFFMVSYKPGTGSVTRYRRIIHQALILARRSGINITEGTSFGLDTTRIYPTAIRSRITSPFLRISPGTETAFETEKIQRILLSAIST